MTQFSESKLASQAAESLRAGNLTEAERLCREALASDASHPNCVVVYQEAAAGASPIYSIALDSSLNADRAFCS